MESKRPDTEPMEENTDGAEKKATAEGNGADTDEVTKLHPEGKAAPAVDLQKELLYMRADMENYKRRMLKEQDQAIKYANDRLIKDLLTPLDYLERALSAAKHAKTKGEAEFNNLVSGVDLTHRELVQLLSRFGVEFTGNVGEKFNPALHEAITQIESPDAEPNTVLEVLQKGSLLQGRLLKPARVVVAKKKED